MEVEVLSGEPAFLVRGKERGLWVREESGEMQLQDHGKEWGLGCYHKSSGSDLLLTEGHEYPLLQVSLLGRWVSCKNQAGRAGDFLMKSL